MKTYLLLLWAIAFTMMHLLSCNSDNLPPEENTTEQKQAIEFQATIESLPQSGMAWAVSDAIGIFMVEHGTKTIVDDVANKKYFSIVGNSVFIAETNEDAIYYPADGKEAGFIAYYPYQQGISGLGSYSVNVATQEAPEAIDLKYAVTTTGYTDDYSGRIPLTFNRQLSKLKLYFTGIPTTDRETAGVEIDGLKTAASFNLATGVLSAPENIATVIPFAVDAGISYEAVILPGTVADDEVTITLTLNGTSSSCTLPAETYLVGEEYSYELEYRDGTGIGTMKPLTDITVDQTPLSLEAGNSIILTATPVPEDAGGILVWESEDINVATVTQDGRITAVEKGSTNIVVRCGDIRKTIPVTVYRIVNVSSKKPVTASDVLTTFVAANAVDDNPATRWVANDANYSQHWLEIDLQGTYAIARIVIDGDDAILMSDFAVQALVNSEWVDLLSVTDSRTGDYDVPVPLTATTKIRYIANHTNYYPTGLLYDGVRLWEIEVYAKVSQ
jgi:hypothetical protein